MNPNENSLKRERPNDFHMNDQEGGGGGGYGGRRGGRGRPRGGHARGPGRGMMNHEDRVLERLQNFQGPTTDLPPREIGGPKKFTNHCRLFVGNISQEIKQDDFEEMFKKFGEIAEVFMNKEKGFGFVKMDYRTSAEKAKAELDGTIHKGRTLKIRYATHGSALRVKNLSPFVSNELLERGFGVFGEIENAVVVADAKGKSTGEGIVEFVAKPSAILALKMCTEGCFFLTASHRPVVVQPFEEDDNTEGLPDKNLPKRNPEFLKERELAPRFATPGSFEFEYGSSWKALYELKKQKLDAVESEIRYEMEKLDEQMEYARFEHDTNKLREELSRREMARERQMRDNEMRSRQREEAMQREQEMYRTMAEEMQSSMHHRREEMMRRPENNMRYNMEGNVPGNSEFPENNSEMKRGMAADSKPAMETYQAGDGHGPNFEGQFAGADGGNWPRRNPGDDFQNKRRKWQ